MSLQGFESTSPSERAGQSAKSPRPARQETSAPVIRATTVLAVRRDGKVAMAADGQVTMGDVVMKHHARKLRPVYGGLVLTGFAGTAADGLALLGSIRDAARAPRGPRSKSSHRAREGLANRSVSKKAGRSALGGRCRNRPDHYGGR